ncbi:MAG: thiamine-phosphate pyrophosphorylase [Candidatus Omnitrophota bacterium]
MKEKLYRIIDANLNRSREGLRVCEEIARFVLDDGGLTKEFKSIRHGISDCIKLYPATLRGIVSTRDSEDDVGNGKQKIEKKHGGWRDVSAANMERVKESLRVLEEFSKLIDKKISDRFKRLRFRAYNAEKKLVSRF